MGDTCDKILEALHDDSRQHILNGHKFRCFDSHIDPSGEYLATASEDGTVCIWKLESGELKATLEHISSEILRVYWAPPIHEICEQYFCFGCADGTVHLFTYREDSPWVMTAAGILEHGDSQIYHCQFIVGDCCWQNKLSGLQAQERKEEGKVNLSGEEEKKRTETALAPVCTANSLESNSIQMQIVTACDNLVYVWDVHSLRKLTSWQYPKVGENSIGGPRNPDNISYVFGMGISRDKVAVALSDGTVRVNETTGSNASVAILQMQAKTHITSVAWSPNSQYLLSCAGNGLIFVWDCSSWDNCCILAGHTGPVYGALFLTEFRLVSWSSDCTLRFWDIPSSSAKNNPTTPNKCINPFHTQTCGDFPIYNCAISCQQNFLALVGGGNSSHGEDCGEGSRCVGSDHSIIHGIILDLSGRRDAPSITGIT